MNKPLIHFTVVIISVIPGMMLTLLPLPEWMQPYRPVWVPMILIYWTLAIPQSMGLSTAWITGLLMDAAQGTLLGQHAMGYTITVYITHQLYRQLQAYPLGYQAFMVGLALLPFMSLTLWINGIQGHAPNVWNYWAPIFSSIVGWPILARLLQDLIATRNSVNE